MKNEKIVKIVLVLGLAAAIFVPSPDERFEKEKEPEAVAASIEYKEQEALYDVPLSDEIQRYIMNVCRYYEIDPALVLAVIEQESGYDETAVGDGGEAYGLMQVQVRWHLARMERLGVTDLLNPYENVAVGVDILAEKLDEGLGTGWALMAYNGGNQYANEMKQAGRISDYAKGIIERAEELNGILTGGIEEWKE